MASASSSIGQKKLVPLLIGVALGVIGCHIVKKIRASSTTSSSSSHSLGEFNIVYIKSDGSHEIRRVLLPEFRKLVSNDELNALRENVGWLSRTEKMWQNVFLKSSHFVCVRQEGKLIASGRFVGDGRMGMFYDIHVLASHRRQKVGTLIMNLLIKNIKKQNYSSVGLFGWKENHSVGLFYEKFGFKSNPYAMEASVSALKTHSGS